VDFRTWTESRFRTGTHRGASAPRCGLGPKEASASGKPEISLGPKEASVSGEKGFVPDQTELRLPARRNHRGKVGDCRGPDWSDIVTSEQTPRGRDFGQASSGFCASRNRQQPPSLLSGPHRRTCSICVGFGYFARSRKLETVRENEAVFRLADVPALWHCPFYAEGQPDATPKGNRRRAGVKTGQGPETDSTDGTTERWAGVKAPPLQPRLTVRRKVVSFGS
jgi:hypothetical protein